MASKQEKIKAWLTEQGYRSEVDVNAVYKVKECINVSRVWSASELAHSYDDPVEVLGVFKNYKYIQAPSFQDDQPEPKDKALQEYIKYNKGVVCMDAILELAERVKALEAKTLSNYMEDYPTAKLKEAANEKA